MPNLLTTSKSFLEWAQSLPHVVIPAGLESDMQEAIASSEAIEHSVQRTEFTCSHCGAPLNEIGKCTASLGVQEPPRR